MQVLGVFEQVTARAGPQASVHQMPVDERGEDQHRHLGVELDDAPADLSAGGVWQMEVEDHDVGLLPGEQTQCLFAAACLAHNLEARIGIENEAQTLPHDLVVIHEHEPHRLHTSHPPWTGRRASTVTPFPPLLAIVNSPLTWRASWRIVSTPNCRPCATARRDSDVSSPMPSSWMVTTIQSGMHCSRTATPVAWACLCTL